MTTRGSVISLLAALVFPLLPATAQPVATPYFMENIGRGLVGIRTNTNNAYLSWRLLGTEDPATGFHVYRSIGGGAPVRLTSAPVTVTTTYSDSPGGAAFDTGISYHVTPVLGGVEGAPGKSFDFVASAPVRPYIPVPIEAPPAGITPAGDGYVYSANDVSIGDLTGDGQYEFVVKWEPGNAKDNAHSGYTGNVILDAYTMDGTRLWRIDLGRNIRAGAHYTQFIVYDLDSDGRAELSVKTAPGTVDGLGRHVLLPGDNPDADYRNSSGYILSGPEYLTVFDGLTGANLATVPYVVPRHPDTWNPTSSQLNSVWGDGYGNRVDRFNAAVAYLDGERPSLIMARGIYTRVAVAAWDWRDGELTMRWLFDTHGNPSLNAYRGQGNHQLSIADVDGDGRQEIICGAATIDHDGTGLYSSGLGHGDALHVGDLDPNRPGLEIFSPFESPGSNGGIGTAMRDAATGEIIWSTPAAGDVGRGVTMDIDPRYPGSESWATNSSDILAADGTVIARKPSNMFHNFGVWWDGDLQRELLDGTTISKWLWSSSARSNLLTAWTHGASANNGTKSTPALSGDILGDWREEVVWRNGDSTELMIFTSTHATSHRLWTFLHDPQYRVALAWQNVAYNQPPHPGFFVGADMKYPPQPNIRTDAIPPPMTQRGPGTVVWTGAESSVWQTGGPVNWMLPGESATVFLDGDDVIFGPAVGGPIVMDGILAPASVVVERTDAMILGGAGSLAGSAVLTKRGTGVLTLGTANAHEGGSVIEEGTVAIGHPAAMGSGPVVLRGGTYATGSFAPANPIVVEAASRVTGGHSGGAHAIHDVSGSEDLTAETTSVFDFQGNMNALSGRLVLAGSGFFRLFGSTGAPDADLELSTAVSLNARSGTAMAFGSLAGVAGSLLSGSSGGGNNASVTYTIGGKNTDSVFHGVITNGNNATSLIKTGSGRLTLTGGNNHTGATTIQSGMLVVDGSLGNTAVTVQSGGALGGSGSIGGSVACHGMLSPGAEDPGTLHIQGALALMPGSALQFSLGAGHVSDGLSVGGELVLDGVLHVTDSGGLGAGVRTLVSHAGAITDNGLEIGSVPEGFTGRIEASGGTVRLVLTAVLTDYGQWQLDHFGDTDHPDAEPGADPDGDGTDNLTEFLLGLDPKNGGSAFRASGINGPDGFTIIWPWAPGLLFEIRRSATLDSEDWELLGTVTGTGTYTDESPPQERAFYRVVLLLP